MSAPYRVVVVDDHRNFALGISEELSRFTDITVAARAHSVDEAIDTIVETCPDVVLLDVHLPGGRGGGGAEVARSIAHLRTEAGAPVRALALSVSDSEDDVIAVIRAGARGYVTKSITPVELANALRRVAGGDAVFSPRLAGFVLDAFRAEAPGTPSELDLLSAREQQVMRLIARGYSYREAAASLFISDRTIESHVSNVLKKLQLSNRQELTKWAKDRRVV